MYCKKCRKLLKDSSLVCPSCGFDNNNEFNIENTAELELQKIVDMQNRKTQKEQIKVVPIICVIIAMFAVLLGIHFLNEAKEKELIDNNKTTIPSTIPSDKDTKFKYKKLNFIYPDSFGSTSETIFYKAYEGINIKFETIDEVQYNDYLNSADIMDTKLGDFEAKTFPGDNYYSYLLIYKKVYYLITVNYVNDVTIYTEDVQLTIHSILNSIIGK